jgi:hypothetical protein
MSAPSRGAEDYADIAEELGGELTLDDIDPRCVERAKAYAKRSHKRWPPRPTSSGWQVTIWTRP